MPVADLDDVDFGVLDGVNVEVSDFEGVERGVARSRVESNGGNVIPTIKVEDPRVGVGVWRSIGTARTRFVS